MFSKVKFSAKTSKSSFAVAPKTIKAPAAVRFGTRATNNIATNAAPFSLNSSSSMKMLLAGTVAIGAVAYNTFEEKKKDEELNIKKDTLVEFPLLNSFPSLATYAAEKAPIHGVAGTNKERSFIAIKPDGVHRGYIGEVIKRFEDKGYKLVGIKVLVPSKDFAEKHYADLSKKPFFNGLVSYFSSGPVVAMVWEGKDVITGGRSLIGATNPQQATPGTIRGDYAITIGRNMIHGSDSAESAKNEISLWFTEKELAEFDHALDKWVHEK